MIPLLQKTIYFKVILWKKIINETWVEYTQHGIWFIHKRSSAPIEGPINITWPI